jgi:hypothetical protein
VRPSPSEIAAAAWLAGGLVATGVLQAATGGRHSVSDGLRAHRVAFGALAVAFLAHIYVPGRIARLDPFRLLGRAAGRALRHPNPGGGPGQAHRHGYE